MSLRDIMIDGFTSNNLDYNNFLEPNIVKQFKETQLLNAFKLSKFRKVFWKPDKFRLTQFSVIKESDIADVKWNNQDKQIY